MYRMVTLLMKIIDLNNYDYVHMDYEMTFLKKLKEYLLKIDKCSKLLNNNIFFFNF